MTAAVRKIRPAKEARAGSTTTADSPGRIGIALAGGGFLGAAYELGALAALAESIDGLDLNGLDAYVGVSVGSFVAAGLANGLSPYQMVRMFVDSEDSETSFDPTTIMQPAYEEIGHALRALPGATWAGLKAGTRNMAWGIRPLVWRAIEEAGLALPVGLVDSSSAREKLAHLLKLQGGTDDFRQLKTTLRIVATDIDSGLPVEFGSAGFDDVPISVAVAASSAVPGLFAPVRINNRYYVDGALNKTLHASVALDAGAGLVFCVNPLVPFTSTPGTSSAQDRVAAKSRRMAPPHRNLTALLSQSVRTVIRSRMGVGLEKYGVTYPDADIVLFEPRADDARMFYTGIFSLRKRRQLCEHAYQRTREDLTRRAATLEPVLRKHGLAINHRVLADRSLNLLDGITRGAPARPGSLEATLNRLRHVLDDLDRTLYLSRLT